MRIIFFLLISFYFSFSAFCADTFTLVIKDHQFTPRVLKVPAGQKIKICIDNQDPTVEEFESFDLNREKTVGGHKQIIVFIGPLKPKSYTYVGDFHPKSAKGIIQAE